MSDAVSTDDVAAELFGPYRIEELLGRGGMGEVHRAYDTVHRRYVALKRLPGVAGEEFRARFRREARIAADLNSPHIVPINAHGEIDGQLYLDMRLVDGPDLKRLLANGPLDPVRANEILGQVAGALDAAHAKNVLHRDIKPANILLDADGTAYLADFGIARSIAPEVTKLTQTGEQIGTLDYMAPERLMRDDVDAASDVYSLACVLFQCLTGRVPFPAPDTVGKLAAQLNDPPPAPSLFDRRIPSAMDLVVRTGMDKDPRRRYPTAGELMAAATSVTAEAPTAAVIDLPSGADPGQTYFVRLLATFGGRQATAEPPTSVVHDRCPYPGLQSFGAAEAEWFFGREQAVRDLLARLARQHAAAGPLLVVGASGAGKSSLLHAGLLAAHTRQDPTAPRLAMTPGERPIGTLAARLAALTHTDAQRLAWQLYQRPTSLGEVCRSAVASSDAPLVIAVDQLEELFTQTVDPHEREAFVTALASAGPARVVLAVRADFVEHCITLAPLKPALAAPYVLGPLTVDELAQVVTKPAEAAGLVLEPGLVERLITDVGAGRDPGALPRLAHALRETWHNRSGNVLTLKGYQETGGVDRAVALTADGVYTRLNEYDQYVLRAAMLRMVTLLDGGAIARRRAARADIPPRVLESLVTARLVTVDRDSVTLSHDALLTAWPRLGEWVAEDRQGLLIRQQLDEASTGWRAGGQDRADLYRGARLAAALDWAANRADLTKDEWSFLQASDRDRRRRTRRLRGLVAGLTTLLVLALVAGFVAVVAYSDAERERNVALSRQFAAQSLAEGEIDPVSAMRNAVRGWRASHTPEARGALLSARMLSYPAAVQTGIDNVRAADINPDSTLIAVGNGDGEIVLWDIEAGRARDVEIANTGAVAAVKFSPDGSLLATSSLDSENDKSGVYIWDVHSGRQVSRLMADYPGIGAVAWRPDGKAIAAVTVRADGSAWVPEWDPRTGGVLRWVASQAQATFTLAYGVDGDRLAIGRADGGVELWEPATAKLISSNTDHRDNSVDPESAPVLVAMSKDLLATGGVTDNMIRFWNPRDGRAVRQMPDVTRHASDPGQGPSAMTFSMDGSVLYTNSDANTISLWNPISGAYMGGLPQGPRTGTSGGSTVLAVAVSGDGRTRMAANSDGTILRWLTNEGWHIEPEGSITGLAFHPDGQRLTAGEADGGLFSWDLTTSEQAIQPGRVDSGVFGVAYTKDGTRIIASNNATFVVNPPRRVSVAPRSIALAGRVFRGALAVSPDGRWLAAGHEAVADDTPAGEDHRITVWDIETLTQQAELKLDEQWPVELLFSPDGDTLRALTNTPLAPSAGAGPTGGVAATNMVTWRVPSFSGDQRRPISEDTLNAMVFTQDGDTLIVAGTPGDLQLRDATTGEHRESFGQHPSGVRALAISPDGTTLASVTTEDSLVRLWDIEKRELIAVLHGHGAAINRIEFSPDGTRLATGGTDTDVGVWLVDPEEAADQICADLRDADVPDLDAVC
ncbi:nSTAND1 domain-containing NTPase [Actinophytocola sediminis]